ncbi:MAG: PadR family transcriptional regulator [Longimicrobiales bacterium]
MPPVPNPDEHLPLPPHAFQILLSVLDGERHGYAIIKDIEERTGGEMMLGTSTAYAAIKRMERDGLLEGTDGPRGRPSAGPRRRYYRLTDFGRAVARAEGVRIERLQRMIEGSSLLGGSKEVVRGEAGS